MFPHLPNMRIRSNAICNHHRYFWLTIRILTNNPKRDSDVESIGYRTKLKACLSSCLLLFVLASSLLVSAHPLEQQRSQGIPAVENLQMAGLGDMIREGIQEQFKGRKQAVKQFIVKQITGKIEETIYAPLGQKVNPGEGLTQYYPEVFSEFNPIFESTDWGGPRTDQVEAALQPIFDLLWQDFGLSKISEEISLYPGQPNPKIQSVTSNQGPRARIQLAVDGWYFQQYTYQFAHEITHLFSNFEENNDQKFGWLEEMFAEMGSAYVLLRFTIDPPYAQITSEQWGRYYNDVYGKLDDNLISRHGIEREATPNTWMDRKIHVLQRERYDRELNWGFARTLLPHFVADPTLWEPVALIFKWDTRADRNLLEFINSWEIQALRKGMNSKLFDLLRSNIPSRAIQQ